MEKKIDSTISDNINELAAKNYRNSVNKGFWDSFNRAMGECKNLPTETSIKTSRDFIETLWLAKNLMEASGELGEALEGDRTNRQSDWAKYYASLEGKEVDFDPACFAEFIKDSVGDEIADCIIRLLQFCYGTDINIGQHIVHKMAYNAQRERLHGKKF